jgi:vancomycin permeability regulator SanA
VKRLACLLVLAGCSDAKDLLRPYERNSTETQAMLARKWPVAQFDVAIVLGCPAELDGTPSMCQRCRVKTAVRDWRKGVTRNLLFSGGAAHSASVEADVMGDLAIRRGVPPDRVLREGRALTTWQNIRFAKRMLAARGWQSILFISTADHLARAHRIAEYYGIPDEKTGWQACDLDLPPDSEAEWQTPSDGTPQKMAD